MTSFLLWKKKSKVFPTAVHVSDEKVPINSDFRIALQIMHLHSNPDITDLRKYSMMLGWFYPEVPTDAKSAMLALVEFLAPQKEEEKTVNSNAAQEINKGKKTKNPTHCFEFDAEEIYVSFLQDYNVDLIDIDYLHWYKFLMMFSNLSKDTPMMKKMELRTMDLSSFKGKEKARLTKAQKSVQIPQKLTKEESDMMSEFMKKIGY